MVKENNMKMKAIFRLLVILEGAVGLTDALCMRALFNRLPHPLLRAWRDCGNWGRLSFFHGLELPLWTMILILAVAFLIIGWAYVGMLCFWPSGRLCYILAVLGTPLFLRLMGGVVLEHHVTGLLNYIDTLLIGAVVALAFLSPVKNEFEKNDVGF